MVNENNAERHALFRAIDDDGTRWLFVILGDDGWIITCNGEQLTAGTSDSASVDSGVTTYLACTKAAARQLQAAVA